MKLSDYIAEFLYQEGIRHVFLISGGAIIHTVDSVSRRQGMQFICPQHEQGGAAAADAYARMNGNLGAAIVTSGPGATNLVTSVCNAYFDSIPVLFISGQVATSRLRPDENLRQKGFQETDVVSIFKSITKYAVQIKNAHEIKYELTKAVYLAKSGRPGPVLIDIPDDIQRIEINPDELSAFVPDEIQGPRISSKEIQQVVQMIQESQRPVLLLGAGVRLAQSGAEAIQLARQYHLPVLLTWGAMDLFPYDDPLNMGGVGVCGPRGGNFAVQTSDLVIAMGTRLSQQITGGKQDLFAPQAKKIMIDIDTEEFKKFKDQSLKIDLALACDLREFFKNWQAAHEEPDPLDCFKDWRDQISQWKKNYPICPPEYRNTKEKINVYVFMKELSWACREGNTIITDAGGNLSWTMQAFEVKKNQRLFSAWNHSPMGYSLPAAIGAALAGQNEVICIIGDGGLMMCLSELATVKRYNLPVKVFVINNHGHGIQKQTLDTWMNGRYVAVDEKTGLAFPDFMEAGKLFGLPTFQLDSHEQLRKTLGEILNQTGPVLCNVEILEDQKITPMLKFGAGLEDLSPPIARDELAGILNSFENVKAYGEKD